MKKNWTLGARILTFIYIGFLSLFALDVFEEGLSPLTVIVALGMHLIPSFVLIAILVVAWKNELIGGILFLVCATVFTLLFNTFREPMSFFFISIPLLVISFLFIYSSLKVSKRRKMHK